MRKDPNYIPPNEVLVSGQEFMESFNTNMPENYPKLSLKMLEKFKEDHAPLFKQNGLWSLDLHRKRMIDWLRQHM